MYSNHEFIPEILKLGLDDWFNLTQVVEVLKEFPVAAIEANFMRICLNLLEELLVNRLVKIGDISGEDGSFVSWNLEVDQILFEIERRWIVNSGPFNYEIGEDVCWLANTEKGQDIAARSWRQID